MQRIIFGIITILLISFNNCVAESVVKLNKSDGFPEGQSTPEGVACDAVRAYLNSDDKLWLKCLVRPIYGEEGNKEYGKFKKMMVDLKKKNAKDPNFPKMKIVKVFKAQAFSKNGPGSLAYAMYEFTGNLFVDLVIDLGKSKQSLRYQVLQDKDKKWYFNPRPDLSQLLAMGLNEETESTEVWKKENGKNAK